MRRHLFVPDLLGPMPGIGHDQWPALPHLEKLLARADRRVEPVGYAAGLFALFDVATPADVDPPTAAVCLLADSDAEPEGFLLHADPLQLLPDRDCLLAFDLDDDPLDEDEIAQLVAVFNSHFEGDGVRLAGSATGALYLHCAQSASIRTHPLWALIGRNMDLYLPEGADQRRWRGLLNETQMLCHALDLNREREALGRPTLSGLWFSGGGHLPPAGQGTVARLVGDCRLARGLMALCTPVGDDELIVEHGPGRAVRRADAGGCLQAFGELEARIPELQRGCDELHIHPGNGVVYCWHARAARRFWRRTRPISTHLSADPTPQHGRPGGNGV